mmetsp:Transcript_2663/g.4538  ORF Transcript_2663/g.4538 Transcript_2663/m.4538 type:complete len:222 (-) Transcript_2663:8-673(-)
MDICREPRKTEDECCIEHCQPIPNFCWVPQGDIGRPSTSPPRPHQPLCKFASNKGSACTTCGTTLCSVHAAPTAGGARSAHQRGICAIAAAYPARSKARATAAFGPRRATLRVATASGIRRALHVSASKDPTIQTHGSVEHASQGHRMFVHEASNKQTRTKQGQNGCRPQRPNLSGTRARKKHFSLSRLPILKDWMLHELQRHWKCIQPAKLSTLIQHKQS